MNLKNLSLKENKFFQITQLSWNIRQPFEIISDQRDKNAYRAPTPPSPP